VRFDEQAEGVNAATSILSNPKNGNIPKQRPSITRLLVEIANLTLSPSFFNMTGVENHGPRQSDLGIRFGHPVQT